MASPAVPTQQPARQRGLLVIYSALMLAMLLAALDQTIVATALPTIVSDLGGLSHLSWVVTAYILASTRTRARTQGPAPPHPPRRPPRGHRRPRSRRC